MKYNIVFVVLLAIVSVSCNNNQNTDPHTHQHDTSTSSNVNHEHTHDSTEGDLNHAHDCNHDHSGEEKIHSDSGHKHEENTEQDCDHDHSVDEELNTDLEHNHSESEVHNCDPDHAEASELQSHEGHDHADGEVYDDGHNHAAPAKVVIDDGHNHGDVKIQLTAYSDNFEVFAEADPFVVGKNSFILAHFSTIPNFRALKKGSITASLLIDGAVVHQKLNKPIRQGIYGFELRPGNLGTGSLIFDIETDEGKFQLTIPNVEVFRNEHDAIHVAEEGAIHNDNVTVFTKEQSWKIDFATSLPSVEPFGQMIKTTAQVQPSPGDEMLVSAKASGIVMFASNNIVEGIEVAQGEPLISISGSGLADNNLTVRYMEASNNYEKAKTDYERKKELAESKIVSEKELLEAKYNYDNAKVIYDNLNDNFSKSGQTVKSPLSGYINRLFVTNGQYVEVGQALFSIFQNKTLLLNAEVQQKYSGILADIYSANIHSTATKKIYTLEELNGKLISYGRSVSPDNYLIPITLQIDNNGQFLPGGFLEVYLKTISNNRAMTIQNSALLEEQGHFFVFVQITPELFEMREVKTGATDGLKTEITTGIFPGERIVTKGAVLIKLARSSGALDPHSGHVH